ncbi:hypothetical protein MMC25_002492 [Agyrium rufum]|nr:hypothetical protein [Agyrium rufum]
MLSAPLIWCSIVALLLDGSSAAPIEQITIENRLQSSIDIQQALKEASVIPDVSLGNVISPSNTTSPPVIAISPLSAPALPHAPTRTLTGNVTYTLVLSDPDATSRAEPTKGQMCHWILSGLTLASTEDEDGLVKLNFDQILHETSQSDHGDMTSASVEEIVEYLPPSPPPRTGNHRYVFVLLAGLNKGSAGKPSPPSDRPHWGYGKIGAGVKEWAKENNLVVVGK